MMDRSSERGSVLVYILIAVTLFAALGFALSRSSRDDSSAAGQNLVELQATEILQFARALQTAVQTMRIDGIPAEQVSFESDALPGYQNAGCTTDKCRVFLPDGGDLVYAAPVDKWLDTAQGGSANYGQWVFSGSNAVQGVGTDGTDAGNVELVAILPWITHDLCAQLNKMLGIGSAAIPASANAVDVAAKFAGTYTPGGAISAAALATQRTGCFQGGGTPAPGTYHFYQVLLAR